VIGGYTYRIIVKVGYAMKVEISIAKSVSEAISIGFGQALMTFKSEPEVIKITRTGGRWVE
jgi:hypothetical protein